MEKPFKILNNYGGIGGNRKLWGDEHEITMVEHNEDIAQIYKDHFPNDKIVIANAHEYLLEHFREFDFIWSSPPCPTHSRAAFAGIYHKDGSYKQKPQFPDMKLYEEIIFLKHIFKGKWCVENVVGYYEPLIKPYEMEYHYWWTNFHIREVKSNTSRSHHGSIEELQEKKMFNLDRYKIDKILALRNCVEPEMGKHILDCAINESQMSLI